MVGTCLHIKYLAGLLLALGEALLLIAPPVQAATVTLSSTTSPSSGQPGTTNISVTGSGFPTGTIPASNVTVTLQPPGSGGSVTTTASAVRTIAGPVHQVSFQIPASVVVSVATTYQVSIAGTTSTGVAFSSGNTSALTVIPAASIVAVIPNTGQPGQALSVTISAIGTNFVQGSTKANFGAGISVGGAAAGTFGPVTVTSPTTAIASVVIAVGAAPGGQTVVVDPGGQQAALPSGFTVAGAPIVTGISNTVSLSFFQASAYCPSYLNQNLQDQLACNIQVALYGSNSFSIQQNFYIITPSPLGGAVSYWVQNVIVVFKTLPFGGAAYAVPYINVFDCPCPSSTQPRVKKGPGIPLPLSGPLTLDSNVFGSGGLIGSTLTLVTYVGQVQLSSYSLSQSDLPSLTGQSYIGLPSGAIPTPGPPELVLVGPGDLSESNFTTDSVGSPTAGSITSQIILNNNSFAGTIRVAGIGVTTSGAPETGEKSTGLFWTNLPPPSPPPPFEANPAWTTSNSPQFTAQFTTSASSSSSPSFEGIWFEPANGTAALVDNFTSDSSLNANLWTTSSTLLNSLAARSSSPPASFVTPTLSFSSAGMEMSGVNGFLETAGVLSQTSFTAPFTVQVTVKGTEAAGNPFEIFLVSNDLTPSQDPSQFLTVSGNLSASNGGYYGIWATAPNISQLWQLGDQLQPSTLAAPNVEYTINITVNANGSASVTVEQTNGTLSGSASNLQVCAAACTKPFYLVLGQREGLPFNGPGPNVAYWGSVSVTQQ
jgi:hypothetical protein